MRRTKENNYGYDYHPKITGDHSHLPMFVDMMNGKIKGFFVMGQNPAVGGQNARFQRKALAKLDWMVVRDYLRDRDLGLLEKFAGGHGRGGKAFGHQDRGLLTFLLPWSPRWKALLRIPSASCSSMKRRQTRPMTPGATSGSLTSSASS